MGQQLVDAIEVCAFTAIGLCLGTEEEPLSHLSVVVGQFERAFPEIKQGTHRSLRCRPETGFEHHALLVIADQASRPAHQILERGPIAPGTQEVTVEAA